MVDYFKFILLNGMCSNISITSNHLDKNIVANWLACGTDFVPITYYNTTT